MSEELQVLCPATTATLESQMTDDAERATAAVRQPANTEGVELTREAAAWEDQLLHAVSRKDRTAFRSLYDVTSRRMFAQALSILRSRDAAEDAVQDAYVRVWTVASSYDPARGHAVPWMLRIVRNIAIDRLRRDRLRARYHDCDDTGFEIPALAEPVDDRIDLVRGLDALAAPQRDAIVRVVVVGWTHNEAGEQLGVPTPTAKARAQRGLGTLRARYEKRGHG